MLRAGRREKVSKVSTVFPLLPTYPLFVIHLDYYKTKMLGVQDVSFRNKWFRPAKIEQNFKAALCNQMRLHAEAKIKISTRKCTVL